MVAFASQRTPNSSSADYTRKQEALETRGDEARGHLVGLASPENERWTRERLETKLYHAPRGDSWRGDARTSAQASPVRV